MKIFNLLLLCAATTQASPWKATFQPLTSWEAASLVKAAQKALQFELSEDGEFYTNASNPKKAGYLQTTKKYGDCTVEAEFMIPKDSNSGIYLMGRHEIQILDSHGKEKPGAGDMGGVYQRWDAKRTPKGFEGVAPLINAAKPAGEWQKLVIKFRAPRFDEQGDVSQKPIFLSVVLNDKLVQENVTLNGPTRAAQRKGFVAEDFIFIQGDHGPIAFRSFTVKEENFKN